MRPLVFLATIVIIWIESVSGEELYPNFTCYKDYNDDRGTSQRGTGRILYAMRMCRPQRACYKSCVLEYHSIIAEYIEREGIELMSIGGMVDFLAPTFFNSNFESATKIAEKMVSKCKKLFEEKVKKSICIERHDFFICLENAWAC